MTEVLRNNNGVRKGMKAFFIYPRIDDVRIPKRGGEHTQLFEHALVVTIS